MNDFYCDNCSCKLTGDEEFCPKCEIQLMQFKSIPEDYYICPVCQSKNPSGERKCSYCCSIL